MNDKRICPHCGKHVEVYRNPFPTVDIIIEMVPEAMEDVRSYTGLVYSKREQRVINGIVLIKRKNPPFGWALPGGFVDYGESLETAAIREAKEETSLNVKLLYQLGAYSEPNRDPRCHTITVVFVARAKGVPKAADDAVEIGIYDFHTLPETLAFDHGKIIQDYLNQCLPKK